jgi:hypothetical protein
MAIISNVNFAREKFPVMDFEGDWLASIGRPELNGSWVIYGPSATGKTTFTLMLLRYLSTFARCLYDSLEEGKSASLQRAWLRAGVKEAGSRVVLGDKETVADVKARLRKRRAPGIVFFDSLTAMPGFNRSSYISLLDEFPSTLFIFTAHEKRGMADPSIAEIVRRLADVKIRVEGYKAFFNTRYADAVTGAGGADFIIWPQGASDYWANKL